MPVTITHDIDAPDYGQAERHRLQQHTFITLLWGYSKTQDVFARLIQVTSLSPYIRRLRNALKRQASLDNIKATDRLLFDAIMVQRKIIGSTLREYVRGLFGRDVQWVTKELIGLFLTQVQVSACDGKLIHRSTEVFATAPPMLEIPVPVGSTMREMRANLRRSTKAKLQALTTRRGRVPKGAGAEKSLVHDASWCFLHIVVKQSLRSLAKQYVAHTHPNNLGSYDGRALVQRAIRETVRRLRLPSSNS